MGKQQLRAGIILSLCALAVSGTTAQALTTQEKDAIVNAVVEEIKKDNSKIGEALAYEIRNDETYGNAISSRITYYPEIAKAIGDRLTKDNLTRQYMGINPGFMPKLTKKFNDPTFTNKDNEGAVESHTIAIGTKAFSHSTFGISLGNEAVSGPETDSFGEIVGGDAVAIGNRAWALGDKNVAIGSASRAGSKSIAIGINAQASFADNGKGSGLNKSYHIDPKTGAPVLKGTSGRDLNFSSVAIGNQARALGNTSIAFGLNATASGKYAITAGYESNAGGRDAIAVGSRANAAGEGAIAIGGKNDSDLSAAQAYGNNSIAIGQKAVAGHSSHIGEDYNSVAIGKQAWAQYKQGVAVGDRACVQGDRGIAIGANSLANSTDAISIGRDTNNNSTEGIAIGKSTKIEWNANKAVAFGSGALVKTQADNAFALGTGALVNEKAADSFAIGTGATILDRAKRSLAIGSGARNNGDDSVVIGTNAYAEWYDSVAIGKGAKTTQSGAVAIGSGSKTTVSSGDRGYDPVRGNTVNLSLKGNVWESTKAPVSIGDVAGNITRRILSVAAGRDDTDAVNVAQLKQMRAYADTKLMPDLSNINDTGKNTIIDLAQDSLSFHTSPQTYFKFDVVNQEDPLHRPNMNKRSYVLNATQKFLDKMDQIDNLDKRMEAVEYGWGLGIVGDSFDDVANVTTNDIVEFGVADADKGLTVTREKVIEDEGSPAAYSRNLIKFGIDAEKLIGNINGQDNTPVTNIAAKFNVAGANGANKTAVNLTKDSDHTIQYLGTDGETTVAVGGANNAPKITVGLADAFKNKVTANTTNIGNLTTRVDDIASGWGIQEADATADGVISKNSSQVRPGKDLVEFGVGYPEAGLTDGNGLNVVVQRGEEKNGKIVHTVRYYIEGESLKLADNPSITKLKDGFIVSDGTRNTDITLGGDTQQAVTFKAATDENSDVASSLVASVDADRNVTYTLNTKQLKKDLGISEAGAGTMSSWKLAATSDAAGVTPATIENDGTVTFGVAEAGKGLTVARDGSTIKYGIDGSQIDIAGNQTITNLTKKIEDNKVKYFSVKKDERQQDGQGNPITDGNSDNAGASGYGSIAIGQNAAATTHFGLAAGYGARTEGQHAVAIGEKAVAKGHFGSAFGFGARSEGASSTAIGKSSQSIGDYSTALGMLAKSVGKQSTALGGWTQVAGNALNGLAIGTGAYVGDVVRDGEKPAVGVPGYSYRKVDNDETPDAGNEHNNTIAIGAFSQGFGYQGVSLGAGAKSYDYDTVAIGTAAHAQGNFAVAIGKQTFVKGRNAVAIGHYAQAGGEGSLAMGVNSFVNNDVRDSLALGSFSKVEANHSVALGADSRVERLDGVATNAYLIEDKDRFTAANGVISVGHGEYRKTTAAGEETVPATYRRITNLAGGADDNDAVNVAQLKVVDGKITNLETSIDGKIAAAKITVSGDTDSGVKVDEVTTGYKVSLGDKVKVGNVIINSKDGNSTIGGLTNKAWDPNAITPGQAATEDQLKAVANEITNIGGNLDTKANKSLDNITDDGKNVVRDLAQKAVKVQAADGEKNLTVTADTTTTPGATIYNVKLGDKVTFGTGDKQITIDGTTGNASFGGGNIAVDGAAQTLTVGKDADKQIKLDGTKGTIGGLTNRTRKTDDFATVGRAATEEQLKELGDEVGTKITNLETSIDGKIEAAKITVKGDATSGVNVEEVTTGDKVTGYKVSLGDKVKVGDVTINSKDGNSTVSGLTNTTLDAEGFATSGRAATEEQLKAAMDAAAAQGKTTVKAGDNITVTADTKTNTYTVSMAKDITADSVTVGKTALTDAGVSYDGKTYIGKDGLNANGKKVTNVAAGDVSKTSTDAVNGAQLFATNENVAANTKQLANINQEVGKQNQAIRALTDESREGDALSGALAALKPLDFDPLQRSQIMAGLSTYRGKQAVAVGIAHYSSEDTMWHGGISYAGTSHLMANVGISWRFGDKEDNDIRKERERLMPQYAQGPISSVYVLQDEVQSLQRENQAIRQENADIREQNKEANARIAQLEQRLDALMARLQ